MRPVKSFELQGIGSSYGGVVHVGWECDSRLPDDEWVLWNEDVNEFVHASLDSSSILFEESHHVLDGLAFSLTYDYYKDIPKVVREWKEVMAKIMKAISWHECACCKRILFTFCDPFLLDTGSVTRQECDCTDEDFTDMMIDEEAYE